MVMVWILIPEFGFIFVLCYKMNSLKKMHFVVFCCNRELLQLLAAFSHIVELMILIFRYFPLRKNIFNIFELVMFSSNRYVAKRHRLSSVHDLKCFQLFLKV